MWWGISLFVFKLRSRRQLDYSLRDEESHVLRNLNRLAGTRQETLPVHKTLDHFLSHLRPAPLAELRTKMVRRLIRMKALDANRLQGHFVIAIDATGWLRFKTPHCSQCLTQKHEGGSTVYYHMVEEAKLLGPSGLALSVGTEFIENPLLYNTTSSSKDKTKQDCELNALSRLAPKIKKDFPQTPICLSNDALYACGRAIQIAKDCKWKYFFTFKPGGLPSVWREFQSLLKLSPENVKIITLPDGTRQTYRWINNLSHEDTQKRTHIFDAIQCKEDKNGKVTTYAWITNFSVNENNVTELSMKGGRIRIKIENQGFNMQKNSDLNLEHAYSLSTENAKAYYYLLQIAHLFLQLLEMGSLLRRLARSYGKTPIQLFGSLKNITLRLLEAFRNRLFPDELYDFKAAASIQIRLDTS